MDEDKVMAKAVPEETETEQPKMVFMKNWQDFRKSGLMWFTNTILHAFGWALVVEVEPNEDGKYTDDCVITNAYPARVKFRGFGEESNTKGYIKVSQYLKDNIDELLKEAQD
jgi:hypothetical protein